MGEGIMGDGDRELRMGETSGAMVLGGPEEAAGRVGCCTESFGFELDVFGRRASFRVSAGRGQARLSDITPLARRLASEIMLLVVEGLRRRGEYVACCKGCSRCCSYLVPLSVPEAFRFREEVQSLLGERGRSVLRDCLNTAKKILDCGAGGSILGEGDGADGETELRRVAEWYGGLEAMCPLLSAGLCSWYEQRPIACREHIVTGSALACRAEQTDFSHVAPMPVSIVQVLGELSAELEGSEVEAVMLPLAFAWAEENLERSERMWPAEFMVERFVEILKSMASSDSRLCGVAAGS